MSPTTTTAATARVFIVQEPLRMVEGVPTPRINYGTLKPYGQIKFLLQWGDVRDGDVIDTAYFLEHLRAALFDFNDDDFLVPLGNPALIALAVLVAAEANAGRVKMLDWIRDEARYRIVRIDTRA